MPIHIRDAELTREKLSIIKNNLDKTHIVADFDATLTKYFDEHGANRQSMISILESEGVLSEEFTKASTELLHIYHPIEFNHTLSVDFKKEKMVEWRKQVQQLLLDHGLTRQHLERSVGLDKMIKRPGTERLLGYTKELQIPFLIFSASGLGVDAVQLTLTHWGIDQQNIDIIGNDLYWDDTGKLTGFSKQVIHTFNKEESVIRENDVYKPIQEKIIGRKHVIIFGDSLGDAAMVKDRDDRTVLRVGLCNDKIDERLEAYSDHFDIVITHDDSFEEVLDMIFN